MFVLQALVGEFIQGAIDGQSFLVTCPINRYSYALSQVTHPLPHYYCSLQPKSSQARQLSKGYFTLPPAVTILLSI